MPTDNKIWIPPLTPKGQKRLSERHRRRKVLKWLSGFTKGFMQWFSFSGKTFWDFLGIIAIPVVIAIATMQFSTQQSDTSARIAQDQQQETALQAYLDHMSDLLLSRKLRESLPGDEVRNVARARTLTVLPQLNGMRKGELLRFLKEAGLIDVKNVIVSLSKANLRYADLSDTDLTEVDLNNADLTYANLQDADLTYANLQDADQNNGGLIFANPSEVNLRYADLTYANMMGINLRDADLTESDITRQLHFLAHHKNRY